MEFIVSEEDIPKLIKAGKIAAQVRREGAKMLHKKGTSLLKAMDYCESRIIELGGGIAWAQYAINEVAAHGCPTDNNTDTTKAGQLIKIDIGVHIDGLIADNAMTIEVGAPEGGFGGKYKDLITASQNALREAIKLVKPGVTLSELGKAQAQEAEKLGLTTIKNLCGHTLAPNTVHAGISIPSYDTKDKTQLKEGMQIAIEPFVTDGDGFVKGSSESTIFMIKGSISTRSPYAKKVIKFTKNLNGLPFTTRWLTREFKETPTRLALKELSKSPKFESYPPLIESSKGMVAQFEHSMIITKDGPLVYTRHEDDSW